MQQHDCRGVTRARLAVEHIDAIHFDKAVMDGSVGRLDESL